MDDTQALSASRQIVIKMKEAGINLVALDFDFTVIDVHTGGRWQGSADDLATHIRPFFRHLIPEVNRSGNASSYKPVLCMIWMMMMMMMIIIMTKWHWLPLLYLIYHRSMVYI